jgi:hypothetical protein
MAFAVGGEAEATSCCGAAGFLGAIPRAAAVTETIGAVWDPGIPTDMPGGDLLDIVGATVFGRAAGASFGRGSFPPLGRGERAGGVPADWPGGRIMLRRYIIITCGDTLNKLV